jgi:hypothetical protein
MFVIDLAFKKFSTRNINVGVHASDWQAARLVVPLERSAYCYGLKYTRRKLELIDT